MAIIPKIMHRGMLKTINQKNVLKPKPLPVLRKYIVKKEKTRA